jgi:hypothetical protein
MPYDCARAVCATFCYRVAGALIPIFGPNFPNDCVPLSHIEPANMRIDENIVARSAREAELFRDIYMGRSDASKSGKQMSENARTGVATIDANADIESDRQSTSAHTHRITRLLGSSTWTPHPNRGQPHSPAQVGRAHTSTPPSVSDTGRGWTAVNHVLPPIASISRSFQHTQKMQMHNDEPAADPWRSAVPAAGPLRQCQRQQRTPLPGHNTKPRNHHAAISNGALRVPGTHPRSSEMPLRKRDAHQTRVELMKPRIDDLEAAATRNALGRNEPAATNVGNRTSSPAADHRSRLALEQHAAAALLVGLSEAALHAASAESTPVGAIKPATEADMTQKTTNGDDEGNRSIEEMTAHAPLDADEHRSKRRRTCSI